MPQDLWEQLEQQKDLLAEVISRAATLEHFFQQSRLAIAITTAQLDPPGPHIVFVSPAWQKLTGYDWHFIKGLTPRVLQGRDTSRAVLNRLRTTITQGESFAGVTWNYRKDGTRFAMHWLGIAAIRDSRDNVTHYISFQREGSEYERVLTEFPNLDIWELLNGKRGFAGAGDFTVVEGMVRGMVEVPELGAI